MKHKPIVNVMYTILLLGNIVAAVLTAPFLAAALISGYIEYLELDWLFLVGLVDALVFLVLGELLDA